MVVLLKSLLSTAVGSEKKQTKTRFSKRHDQKWVVTVAVTSLPFQKL